MKGRVFDAKIDISEDDVKNFWMRRAEEACSRTSCALGNVKGRDVSSLKNEVARSNLLDCLGGETSLDVLELGCGNGRWADNLDSRIKSYVGVDIVDKYIEACRRKFVGDSRFMFECSPIWHMPDSVLQKKYSMVLICGCLMYVNDIQLGKVVDAIKVIDPARIYIQETVSVLDKRLTLDQYFSSELQNFYSAIYRTRDEYANVLSAFTQDGGYVLRRSSLLYDVRTGARSETNGCYWYLTKEV